MAVRELSDGGPDGTRMGQGGTDKIAFYGVTPVAQRASAVQATSNISASSFATIGSNNTAILLEIANTLAALGLWKGSA